MPCRGLQSFAQGEPVDAGRDSCPCPGIVQPRHPIADHGHSPASDVPADFHHARIVTYKSQRRKPLDRIDWRWQVIMILNVLTRGVRRRRMEAVSARRARNNTRYRVLLSRVLPVAIQEEAEYRRMMAAAQRLLEKGERLTPEEGRLLKLLAVLLEDYEQRHRTLPRTPPHEMIKYLLEEKGFKASALWPVIGAKGRVSEMLSGKRPVSKAQAGKLAQFFGARVELFL